MKRFLYIFAAFLTLSGCSQVNVPGPRNLHIPQPTQAETRKDGINERPDSVIYLPLGDDVLIPEVPPSDPLPDKMVGPFELRGETLAGALQLITSDFEVPMAFESGEALTRRVTVSNMRGPLHKVVNRVCALADLYCSYEDGVLIVKDTQTFTVSVPPVGGEEDIIDAVAAGIEGITRLETIIDTGTRTVIYEATQRSSNLVDRYFQRMRRSTAMIIFEIYIWEVSLDNNNATGIQWNQIDTIGKYGVGVNIPSNIPQDFSPISIGLPTTGNVDLVAGDVVRFISSFGAVKTISQPQITMLSGSNSTLRAADTINYVSSLERTVDNGEVSVSTETDSVDTGFTLDISADWDNATVYSNISIELQEFRQFRTFGEGTETELQLPDTTEREVNTQVRIRPGDSLLLAGLVRESDQYNNEGPGFIKPIIPTSRSTQVSNVELVFLMKPRVIVYTSDKESGPVQKNTNIMKQNAAKAMEEKAETQLKNLDDVIEGSLVPKPLSSNVTPSKPEMPPPGIAAPIFPVENTISRYVGDEEIPVDAEDDYMPPAYQPKPKEDAEKEAEPMIGTVPLDLLNPN